MCVYNGTNMFAVILSSDFMRRERYHAGSGSYFDSMNKFLAFITHPETSLSSTTSITQSKAHIYYIITGTGWSYLPDAALVCPLASTDAPLFPNFVGRTQWRAEIIREKMHESLLGPARCRGWVKSSHWAQVNQQRREKSARNSTSFSVLRATSVFY